MRINEDFTKLYKRWKNGDLRKENNYITDFISRQKNPEQIYITDDNIVNSKGSINLSQDDLIDNKIPFKFGNIGGSFFISNCQIDSLKNSPENVGEDFSLFNCKNLKSLKDSPKTIGVNFYICTVAIEDFNGCTEDIGGSIDVDLCKELTSLSGLPNKINVDLRIKNCREFCSLDGLSKEIGGSLLINNCKIIFNEKNIPNDCTIKGKIDISSF